MIDNKDLLEPKKDQLSPLPVDLRTSGTEVERLTKTRMCVLRSLQSVSKEALGIEVPIEDEQVLARNTQMEQIEDTLVHQVEKIANELSSEPGLGSTLEFERRTVAAIQDALRADKVNVWNLVKGLTRENESRSLLGQAMENLVCKKERAGGIADIIQALQNPANQVCIVVPGHMFHIGIDRNNTFFSYSDLDSEGRPKRVDTISLALSLFWGAEAENPTGSNMLIFRRGDRIPLDRIHTNESDLLNVTNADTDFNTSVRAVTSDKRRQKFEFDHSFFHSDYRVYPEFAQGDIIRKGALLPEEATGFLCLARKISLLWGKLEDNIGRRQATNILLGQAKRFGIDDRDIDPMYVVNSMRDFLIMIDSMASSRERLILKNEKRPNFLQKLFSRAGKDKTMLSSLQDQDDEIYADPLTQDQFQIGVVSVDHIIEGIRQWSPDYHFSLGIKDRNEELQKLKLSRELGLQIAKSVYLQARSLMIQRSV